MTGRSGPHSGHVQEVDFAEAEKRVLAWQADAARGADLRERLLVIIVEGDGVPQCALTTWGNAKHTLCRVLYGDVPFNPEDEKDLAAEWEARWSRFCSFDDWWSVDANGKPFGYEGPSDVGIRVRAFFVTYPDLITMRKT